MDVSVGIGVLAGVSASGAFAVTADLSPSSGLPVLVEEAVNTFTLGISAGVSMITPPVGMDV